MNTIKAFIFDLDGVIVDTAIYHYAAWKRLANQLNFDFTEEQNEQLKGISRLDSLKLILQWGNKTVSPDAMQLLATQKNNWYVEMIDKMTPNEILAGAKELLEGAKQQGIKTALGSASKNSSLILQRTGLTKYFDVIVDGNHVTASKPNPEVFLKAATLLNVNPLECLVFEDASAGVQAAKNAEMNVVGIGDEKVLYEANCVVPNLWSLSIDHLQRKIGKQMVAI